MNEMKRFFVAAALAGCTAVVLAQAAPDDARAQADVTKALDGKRLRDVTGNTVGGVVTLTGTVSSFQDKLDANRKLEKFVKVGEISKVNDQITVSGPDVSDQVLGQKLGQKLAVNERQPERTAFEIVNPSVQNGIVTLMGFVTDPVDKSDVEGTVAAQPGVKGIVDKIEVASLSPNDWRVRHDVYRAIYGYNTFTRYGINPVKPIRILVLNGQVKLVGVVDSVTDKEQAGIRANGVGGVFKVTNDLQVAGARE